MTNCVLWCVPGTLKYLPSNVTFELMPVGATARSGAAHGRR
jgi:hypothetical protein